MWEKIFFKTLKIQIQSRNKRMEIIVKILNKILNVSLAIINFHYIFWTIVYKYITYLHSFTSCYINLIIFLCLIEVNSWLKELNLDNLLPEIFTITPIQVERKSADGKNVTASVSWRNILLLINKKLNFVYFQYNLIPKGINSLKVLQELPIIVVLMYQIYKQNVHQEVVEFVPLIMTTITLQPSSAHRYEIWLKLNRKYRRFA